MTYTHTLRGGMYMLIPILQDYRLTGTGTGIAG